MFLLSLQDIILPPETIDLVGVMDVVFVGFAPFSCVELFLQVFHEEI
jgi:hypothetical protein